MPRGYKRSSGGTKSTSSARPTKISDFVKTAGSKVVQEAKSAATGKTSVKVAGAVAKGVKNVANTMKETIVKPKVKKVGIKKAVSSLNKPAVYWKGK